MECSEGARLLPLSAGKFAIVDAADFEWLNQWKWCFHRNGYAFRTEVRDGRKVGVFIHRVLMGDPPCKVDHRNRTRLDCRRDNLRLATNSQNTANSDRPKDSGLPRGVQPKYRRRTFEARIMRDGKSKCLGTFPTAEAAARAYDKAAREMFGEFAVTNYPAP